MTDDRKSERAIDDFRMIVQQRLARDPDNGFYLAGHDQLAIVERGLDATGRLPAAQYSALTLGVMCAREVESVDMPFCDAAYAMLEAVRPVR